MSLTLGSDSPRPYTKHEWWIAGVLFVSYLAVSSITSGYIPASAQLTPAFAIALCALFFGGLRLFPVVFAAALVSGIIAGLPVPLLFVLSIAATVQAIVGAYALRVFHLDPLFRRVRDVAYLVATAIAVSAIEPALRALAIVFQGGSYSLAEWGHAYTAALLSFLIVAPFILRWFAKPRFWRTWAETVETLTVFILLLTLEAVFFFSGVQTLAGIPLPYVLLVPLFWIALRLRPRFVTLALLLTSLFAVANAPAGLVFDTELLLILLAVILLITTSLEEQLRVSTSLMLSQLATLENAVARVSSESSAKNDFIAILAHELRNPLAPIVSAIELLKLKGPRDEDDARTLDMMVERTGVIQRLLNDLLDISSISKGKISFKKEVADLAVALTRAVLSTDHHRKQRHQRLIFKAPETPLYIAGDPMRLEQIFSNLLTNASKYSGSGDTVTLSVRPQETSVEVEVCDEGVGLDSDALEYIFVPFHQLEQDGKTQRGRGLGIGLALVRSFVEMHGGTAVAMSNGLGLGSRFTVTLPLLPSGESGPVSTQKPRALVLVVSDNDATSGDIGRLLELEGNAVLYAYSARQAIEQGLRLLPGSIVIDTDMRGQDGYAIAETLRARGFKGHLVSLTESRTKSGKRSGPAVFEQHITKPAGHSEVRRVMSHLMRLAK